MTTPKKKKKIVLIILSGSRLADVYGENVSGIEFVFPDENGNVAPPDEIETIDESKLSTDEVDALNLLAHMSGD